MQTAGSDLRSFQALFHARWPQLRDPHVRALAWLLDAPGLLDPHAPQWEGRIAQLGPADAQAAGWIVALDRDPAQLHAMLDDRPFTRLGRYAENLLAFWLRERGCLAARNLQVRGARNETVGEFDFLIREGAELVHWEFATKFYLLRPDAGDRAADSFVGPDLADSLGAKIRKIMTHQLMLSQQPGAAAVLPQPVNRAQALVKGWLFYHGGTPAAPIPSAPIGIAQSHCRGFWCTPEELRVRMAVDPASMRYAILPRLSWLAPACIETGAELTADALLAALDAAFSGTEPSPVLIAALEPEAGVLLETDRGFIVPAGWQARPRRLAA